MKFLYIVGTIIIVIFIFLIVMGVTSYKPKKVEILKIENNRQKQFNINDEFSITTFNIGYCGLDEKQDFFMDGGKSSRSRSKEQTQTNLSNIIKFFKQEDSDFTLVQEVDKKSSRSFDVNQYEKFKNVFKKYSSVFALNYKVLWVPVPITKPMGYVNSGIASFSKYNLKSSKRYTLSGKESFVRQLFDLNRCMIENVISLSNGKKLIIINLHLSAYDKGGKVRKKQIDFLKKYIEKQYKEKNYVVVGGDWNHFLLSDKYKNEKQWPEWLQTLPKDFTPKGFKWAIDKNVYTVRNNGKPYEKGKTFATVVDGFLVSPNVEIIKTYGHNLEFENSDHNPVTSILKLR